MTKRFTETLSTAISDFLLRTFPILPSYVLKEHLEEMRDIMKNIPEKKRFEIREEDITVEYDLLYGLQTCIREDGGELLTYMEIVNFLNNLSDENKQLKTELGNIKKLHSYELFKKLQYKSDLIDVRKENEQLKTELTELKASKEDNYNIDDGLW